MSPRAPAEGTHRAAPTPFLTKAYQLVDDPSNNDVVSWSAGGTAFVVWRPDDFARDLLPHRFKHNNFSSFVRQLNTYGFKKVSPNRWEFAHDLFRRGEQHLLCRIERRKAPPVANRAASPASSSDEQVRSSGSSPDPAEHKASGMAELMEENEQLRRENKRLASELAEMKTLCNTIRLLMSGYNSDSQQSIASSGTEASLLLEQMAGDEAKDGHRDGSGGDSPRLFGVHIGSKRSREEEEELLQLMPRETGAGSASEGSICDSQEEENLVQLSLSHVSNRRFCSGLDRYFYPARSESQGVYL